MSEVATTPRVRTTNVQFINAYQTSNSLAEVAQKLGITEGSVTQRRYSLQKQMKEAGKVLKFKSFPRANGGERKKGLSAEQLEELEKLANSLLPEEAVAEAVIEEVAEEVEA